MISDGRAIWLSLRTGMGNLQLLLPGSDMTRRNRRTGGELAVAGGGRAEDGGRSFSGFMGGLAVTNEHADPHMTAIGHSYGSRTVGAATQQEGGIPGVDDIVFVGSPGVGVDSADELGWAEVMCSLERRPTMS